MTLPLTPDELLTTTRSVRKRLDLERPVPMDLVRECIEVALQAPTGSNAQGWHWIVVTDADRRRSIGDYYKRSYDSYRDGRTEQFARLSAERQAVGARVATSADHLADRMGDVPVLVIACITAADELPASNQAGLWGVPLPAGLGLQPAAPARWPGHPV